MRDPDHSNRSGRTSSPAGRQRSSRNALKHGLCSDILILPDESEEEFNDLFQGWLDDYDPRTQIGRGLVVRAARAEWRLLRALRRYDEAEQSVYDDTPDPMHWTEEHHKTIERFTRYRITEERAFARALNMLEHLRKSRRQEAAAQQRIEDQKAKGRAAEEKPHEQENSTNSQTGARADARPEAISRSEPPQEDAQDRDSRPVGGSGDREWEDRYDPVPLE